MSTPVDHVLGVVAREFGLEVEQVRKGSRAAVPSMARHVAAWVLRRRGCTLAEIASALGLQDHTTALYSVGRVNRLSGIPAYMRMLDGIELAASGEGADVRG